MGECPDELLKQSQSGTGKFWGWFRSLFPVLLCFVFCPLPLGATVGSSRSTPKLSLLHSLFQMFCPKGERNLPTEHQGVTCAVPAAQFDWDCWTLYGNSRSSRHSVLGGQLSGAAQRGDGDQRFWSQIAAYQLCDFGQVPSVSVTLFPQLQNRENDTCLPEIKFAKYLEWKLLHSKCFLHIY